MYVKKCSGPKVDNSFSAENEGGRKNAERDFAQRQKDDSRTEDLQ